MCFLVIAFEKQEKTSANTTLKDVCAFQIRFSNQNSKILGIAIQA